MEVLLKSMKLILMFTILLLLGVLKSNAQVDPKDEWVLDCRLWENGGWVSYGMQMTQKYQIGGLNTVRVCELFAKNLGGLLNELEIVELTPGYDPDNSDNMDYWFYTGGTIISPDPVEESYVSVYFMGHKGKSTTYLSPGIYDGLIKLKDKSSDVEYEIPLTIIAWKPEKTRFNSQFAC